MAIGASTFSDFGAGISDLFAASADRSKAQGDLLEAQTTTSLRSTPRVKVSQVLTTTARRMRLPGLGGHSYFRVIPGAGPRRRPLEVEVN
jgi:hypothetical protein